MPRILPPHSVKAGWKIEKGRYLHLIFPPARIGGSSFSGSADSMTLKPTDDGIDEATLLAERSERHGLMEMLADHVKAGWLLFYGEGAGTMTEAPMLSRDVLPAYRDWPIIPDPRVALCTIYWDHAYAIRSNIDAWAQGEQTSWPANTERLTLAQREALMDRLRLEERLTARQQAIADRVKLGRSR